MTSASPKPFIAQHTIAAFNDLERPIPAVITPHSKAPKLTTCVRSRLSPIMPLKGDESACCVAKMDKGCEAGYGIVNRRRNYKHLLGPMLY